MSQVESEKLPYSKNYEVAIWHYIVEAVPSGTDLHTSNERAPWLANLTLGALKALGDFAQAISIEVVTESRGDDSFNAKSASTEDLEKLDKFLRSTLDVSEVKAWLSLRCKRKNSDGLDEEFLIHNSGWLYIINNIYKSGTIAPDDGLARVTLDLQCDIYSPFTGVDNRILAEMNISRLRGFLYRLEEYLPLKLADIDNPYGNWKHLKRLGIIDRYGFKMPDDPLAFEQALRLELAE